MKYMKGKPALSPKRIYMIALIFLYLGVLITGCKVLMNDKLDVVMIRARNISLIQKIGSHAKM